MIMESSYVSNMSANGGGGFPPGGYLQAVPNSSSIRSFSSFMADSSLALSHIEILDQVRATLTGGLGSTPESYEAYLRSIDRLREQVTLLDKVLSSGKELMANAMDTLEARFNSLLRSSSISPDPEELKAAMLSDSAPDHIRPPEVVAGTAHDELHKIAKRLVENGHGETCTRMYRECRGAALQRNFDAMRVLRLTERQVHEMAWTDLEQKMQKWNEHMHIGMIFIAAEREACDLVLDTLEPFRERCFVELSRPSMMLLTSFGLAVAGTKQSPEKLFALLDMYETALDLHQTVDELFAGREGSSVRSEYGRLLASLGGAAKETFEKFEEAVREQPTLDEEEAAPAGSPQGKAAQAKGGGAQKLNGMRGGGGGGGFSIFKNRRRGATRGSSREDDDAKTDLGSMASTPAGVACASGKVHPLASYVINYVIILCNGDLPYFGNLEHAVGEALAMGSGGGGGAASDTASVSTSLGSGLPRVQAKIAFATNRILKALKEKLKARAAAMGDDVLAQLFLMNNFAYILGKIETSDAGRLLGVAWCGECAELVNDHRNQYVANALAKFDPVFAEDKLDNASLQKRLRSFNTTYEKLRQRQLSWSIPNADLRDEVRKAVSAGLLERYTNFLRCARSLIEQHRFMDVNIMTCKQVAEGLEGSFPVPPSKGAGATSRC